MCVCMCVCMYACVCVCVCVCVCTNVDEWVNDGKDKEEEWVLVEDWLINKADYVETETNKG